MKLILYHLYTGTETLLARCDSEEEINWAVEDFIDTQVDDCVNGYYRCWIDPKNKNRILIDYGSCFYRLIIDKEES